MATPCSNQLQSGTPTPAVLRITTALSPLDSVEYHPRLALESVQFRRSARLWLTWCLIGDTGICKGEDSICKASSKFVVIQLVVEHLRKKCWSGVHPSWRIVSTKGDYLRSHAQPGVG